MKKFLKEKKADIILTIIIVIALIIVGCSDLRKGNEFADNNKYDKIVLKPAKEKDEKINIKKNLIYSCSGYKYTIYDKKDYSILKCSDVYINQALLTGCYRKNISKRMCGIFYGTNSVIFLTN